MSKLTTSFKYIRRSPFQATAAVVTMFLAFLLAGFFTLVSLASVAVISYFEGKPQITVFFTDTATLENIDDLKNTLEKTDKVQSIVYISKEEALDIYREQNKSDPLLLELVNADILPASLEITAKEPQMLSDLQPLLSSSEFVEDVVYQKDLVETFVSWTNAIRIGGGILAGILAFDSLLVIITVVGMKIALKKDEIEILKLVGATPWYIRWPFILEGGVYGLIGSGLAGLSLLVLLVWSHTYIHSFLGVVPAIGIMLDSVVSPSFLIPYGIFYAVMLLAGMLLGMFGSLLSVGRYLKI